MTPQDLEDALDRAAHHPAARALSRVLIAAWVLYLTWHLALPLFADTP